MCSPRSYAILQSLFTLPSRKTLHSLLHTIQFKTGMNAHEFSILKKNVQTTSDKVQVCCLMFDEMSIRILTIGGFEDLGSHGWTRNIAHHALVFIPHGLHKN